MPAPPLSIFPCFLVIRPLHFDEETSTSKNPMGPAFTGPDNVRLEYAHG